jgi:hypothetical protein
MQRSAFTRHTVDEDPEVLPGSQIWLDQRCGVWHDLRLVHQSMFTRGVEKHWREWRADCLLFWWRMGVDASHFHLHVGSPELLSNVADSYAAVAVLWQTAETSRSEAWRLACRNLPEALQRRVEQLLAPAQGTLHVLHEGTLTTLLVNKNRLSGWSEWFLSRPTNAQAFFRYVWSKMPECSQTSIDDDDQAVLAILHFAVGF